jgi:D-alanine-D-alanine ligase
MKPTALFISKKKNLEEGARRDKLRFGVFASAIAEGGFDPRHEAFSSIAGLALALERARPTIAFSASDHLPLEGPEGGGGRTLNVHAYLESESLPYVGSSPAAIDLALSKSALKREWLRVGLPTPEFCVIWIPEDSDPAIPRSLPRFPCICKPDDGGNSRGIDERSIVASEGELAAYLAGYSPRGSNMLIEEYLGRERDFREYTVAWLGNQVDPLILPIEHEVNPLKGSKLITTEDKEGDAVISRRVEDGALFGEIVDLAYKAMSAAGIRDYARCDLLSRGGRLFALEVNGQPMVPDSWFGACARYAGLSESLYLNCIFYAALTRARKEGRASIRIPEEMERMIPDSLKRRLR